MALFYTGYRPILRGQSDADWVNTFTGRLGVYSNWQLMSRHQALEGMPQANHTPGTGYSPHDVFLSRKFRGLDPQEPLDAPGLGPRVYFGVNGTTYGPGLDTSYGNRNTPVANHGGRYRPWEFKGITGGKVFQTSFGHTSFRDVSYAFFVNWFFHGVPADQTLFHCGHKIRPIGAAGTAATFGYFDPWNFKGVQSAKQSNNPGKAIPTDRDNVGGHNRVNEWYGVTAANALGTGAGRHHRGNR